MTGPSLLQRLKDRKIVQWGITYLAGAWVLFEACDVVGGRWNLPDALAWAELADTHAREVYYWTDASPDRIEMARMAAQRALEAGGSVSRGPLRPLRGPGDSGTVQRIS
jgi:hypothetical protein